MSIRVLIADDHPIMRTGLTALFETDETITVIGAVGTTAEAISEAARLRPDVVLMDLQFGGAFEGVNSLHTPYISHTRIQ